MILSELIPQNRILCDVAVSEWRDAVRLLARLIAEDTGLEFEPVKDALAAREKLGLTAIGKGVGFPHARLEAMASPTGAFIRLATPLDTGTPDDVPVDIFVCYMSRTVGAELAPLSGLVKHMRDEAFLRSLRTAAGPAEVHALLSGLSIP